jgi:formylglycine-generating enzyme required for sulfatase activity
MPLSRIPGKIFFHMPILLLFSTAAGCGFPRNPRPSIGPAVWTAAAVSAPESGARKTSPADGMDMVFVPEGDFQMGSDADTDYERPVHTVWLDAFWIDETEVTNAQFEEFGKAITKPSRRRPVGVMCTTWTRRNG